MRCFLVVLCAVVLPARGVIFYETGDASHNREVAPGGVLAGSGWQYQGLFGNFLGTMISPQHFITAAHISSAPTSFESKAYFNGVSDITYTVDTSSNSNTGYWDIAGTDLRVFKINEVFPSYAPLYTATGEVGMDLVVMGRGTQRGTTVNLAGDTIGWRWGSADNASRWGTNVVTATVSSDGADYIYATFDAAAGGDEAHLSVGDSGGAVFIEDGGTWKLAGINYAVDGLWDYNDVVDENEFSAALFDARGMYVGNDVGGWTLVTDGGSPKPSGFYSTRISSYHSQIYAIPGVPEASCVMLLLPGLGCGLFRRRDG